MKKKIPSIVGLVLALTLALSLGAGFIPANTAEANPGVAKWEKFPTPRAGSLSNYILVPTTSGVSKWAAGPGPLEKGLDGALFAYWDVGSATNLYKSTDSGRTWSRCSGSSSADVLYHKAIVAIAPSPEDADLLYVTDGTGVFKSSNGGTSFTEVAAPTFAHGDEITCLSVGYDGDSHWIMIGTATDSILTWGGEVLVKQDPYLGPWQDQAMPDTNDVVAIAASPNFEEESNPQIVAVTDNGTHSYVRYQWGGGAWTKKATLLCDPRATRATNTFGNITAADIGFPADYDSTSTNSHLFVAIDAAGDNVDQGGGDVYEIFYTTAYDMDIGGSDGGESDVTSIALAGSSGDEKLLAGAAHTRDVYYSTDSGSTWTKSKKDASGPAATSVYVVVSDDYYESGIAWAAVRGATKGDQSALSQTEDFGKSWFQISLIDTEILSMGDLAFSPAFDTDNTMFMITTSTTGSVDSVWKWDGAFWERTYDTYTFGLTSIDLIEVSPDFATDSAVFIADRSTPKIYRATDGGRWFKSQVGTPTWATGGAWLVIDSKTILVAKSSNYIHHSTNNGVTWSTRYCTGLGLAKSFDLSPDFDEDDSVVAGGDSDDVFRSTNKGKTWKQIPSGTPVKSAAGVMHVAFDSNYATNETVYAAGETSDDVYRWVDGETSWSRIDGGTDTSWPTEPTPGTTISGLVAANGALYAADRVTATPPGGAATTDIGPVLRSINPTGSTTSTRGPYFEPARNGWVAGTASSGIWLTPGSNQLWVKNTDDVEIWTFEDTLLEGPTQTSPDNGASSDRTTEAELAWEKLTGATKYFVWVATDKSFVTGYKGTGMSSTSYSSTNSKSITGLLPGRKYYWKICAADNIAITGRNLSPWSEVRTFTTKMGGGEWNPFLTSAMNPGNVSPEAGGPCVSLTPSFQWEAADWVTGYAFVLADNPNFTSPLVSKTGANALKTTAYFSEVTLEYDKTYYWKVAAIGEDTQSEWGVGIFKTCEKSVPPPEYPKPLPPVTIPPAPAPPAPIAPAYIWAIIGIGAVLVIALIVLIVRTRRVV